jgi:3-phosphoshikimate 1-carboxyvinyltransferase
MPPIARVAPGPAPARWTATVPGSKSITNRVLLLAAAADGTAHVRNALDADDTRVMLDAIRALGAGVTPGDEDGAWVIDGLGGAPRGGSADQPLDLWCGMAGTVGRFLVPVCAAGDGAFAFTADPQLLGRPLGPLLDALRAQGARLDPPDAAALPFALHAGGLAGGHVAVDTSVSSQFLSGLLLAAPLARAASHFAVDLPVSASYVDLTLDALRAFGATVERDARAITVEPTGLRAADVAIEPDASTASYFLAAAAVTGTTVTIPGLDLGATRQGDAQLAVLLERMGCRIDDRSPAVTLTGAADLHGIEADMRDCSDVFMTLACVAPFASSPTTITGIGNVRVKESDRIAAVEQNLARLGIQTESGDDWLRVRPGTPSSARLPTFRDHRIAMAFSVIGLRVPVELEEPAVVDKTCPPFFSLWPATGADVQLTP